MKIIKVLLGFVLLILLVAASYLGYLFLSYQRLPDDLSLKTNNRVSNTLKKPYKITTFNIGYAAYPQDYSFFMDGGKYSRAYDKKTVENNLTGIAKSLQEIAPDFALMQEVDVSGDRSFQVDEVKSLQQKLPNFNSVYGQNYDSAYLFYPFNDPIGKAKSGLLTLSQTPLENARRYSLPIETDFNKFFDLDRAFTVSYTTLEGQKLCLINTHLSAFTKDKQVLDQQIKKLTKKMAAEYQTGAAVIVGGDYNHDLLGDSPAVFNTDKKTRTWTHAFPKEMLPKGFSLAEKDLRGQKVPSVRSNGTPFEEGKTFVSLVDGFFVSDNIEVKNVAVSDLKFENSDHNPVTLTFTLKK